jgi:hypothetical protein
MDQVTGKPATVPRTAHKLRRRVCSMPTCENMRGGEDFSGSLIYVDSDGVITPV